jgi:hypothetical protein
MQLCHVALLDAGVGVLWLCWCHTGAGFRYQQKWLQPTTCVALALRDLHANSACPPANLCCNLHTSVSGECLFDNRLLAIGSMGRAIGSILQLVAP